MEAKLILINLAKVLLLTILTLIIINLMGFLFDLYLTYKNDKAINSFEYDKFSFFLNGNQTHNQISKKYIIFNLVILLIYFVYIFKDYKSIVNKS